MQANIVQALDKLCFKLPKNLNSQCVDLVKDYSQEIISKILEDLTPQEVCVYIKLCDPTSKAQKAVVDKRENIRDKPNCPICLFVIGELYKIIKDDKTEVPTKN